MRRISATTMCVCVRTSAHEKCFIDACCQSMSFVSRVRLLLRIQMPAFTKLALLTALLCAVWAHDANADKENGVQHHRQLSRRKGSVPPEPATEQISVCRGWLSAAGPTGWNRHAVRVSDAMFSSSPDTMTGQ